jgi:hypothetical protein
LQWLRIDVVGAGPAFAVVSYTGWCAAPMERLQGGP